MNTRQYNIRGILCGIRLYLAKGRISAYLDGRLDERSMRKVSALMEDCPGAKAYYEGLRGLDEKMKAVPDLPVPAGMKEWIDLAIINGPAHGKERTHTGRSVRWVYALSTAAAAALAVMIVIGVHDYAGRTRPPNQPEEKLAMLTSLDMYRHIDMYEHLDMVEHLDEVMAVDLNAGGAGRVR